MVFLGSNMSQATQPRKMKLRRLKKPDDNNKQEIIQKNLEPLMENSKKKKRAQQAYYANHPSISPLIRDNRKPSVHQRLGRTLPMTLGTNTSSILPKRKLRLRGQIKQYQGRKMRIFSAQQRLNEIRAKQREVMDTQNGFVPKKIKLRRSLPQGLAGPTNLRVQVKNNNIRNNLQQVHTRGARRFKQILNVQLQHEIKKIQMEYAGSQIIPPMRITPMATVIPLHERFANLI